MNFQKKDQEFTPSLDQMFFSGAVLSFKGNLNLYHQELISCVHFEGKVLNKARENLTDGYVA